MHRVPHIALIYDCSPKNTVKEIVDITGKIAKKYPHLKFLYDGWELKDAAHGYVFGYKIKPTKELKLFREELYKELKDHLYEHNSHEFNSLSADDFWFHSAIVFRLHGDIVKKIDAFIQDSEAGILMGKFPIHPLIIESEAVRISFLSSSRKIIYEYDTILDKIITRNEALSRDTMRDTLQKYREKEGMTITTYNSKQKKNNG